jgi:adenylate cyclase
VLCLEKLADSGGVCVSQKVFEEVEGKLELGFEDLGEQAVKSFPKPVRAYRVRLGRSAPEESPEISRTAPWRIGLLTAAVAIARVVAHLAISRVPLSGSVGGRRPGR